MGSIKSFRDKRLKRLFENEEAESIKGLRFGMDR